MKKIFLLLITCTFVLQMKAQSTVPQYTPEDSIRVMNLLQSAEKDAAKDSTAGQTMLRIGRAIEKMNIPYVAHTLEPNDQERLIINLRELDCTTFVESAMALTLCVRSGRTTFDDYCRILQKIRYWQGRAPQYIRRLHYFTSWIEDNTTMDLVKELQTPNPPFTAVQTVQAHYMTQHVDKYRMLTVNPQDVPMIREMEKRIEGKKYRYIPKQQLYNNQLLRKTIHDGDIIVIITNIKGLDTQHIGIAAWHADGLHLLNASSIHHRVIEEPMTLRQYLYKHPTMPGIRVVRIN
ncbi:MAG: DUF1460 domain-containing protein [Prevotella sp.]|nr:DUF1460 domain-containing protein [Prevotella sp.]MBQ7716794.1 DUF1460 domain-containing protein [Prevotella sp.]MBQ9570343.1 DUF1460 domain-containing protein [Prevotella sp.]